MIGSLDDTIAAAASAAGSSARGVVRLSGPQTKRTVSSVLFPDDGETFLRLADESTALTLSVRLRLYGDDRPVTATIFFWTDGHGYTGEESAEIHTFGSPPILDRLLRRLGAAGVRAANGGEFTLRAFLHGRLDLTRAEAVLGVIDAQRDESLQTALKQLAGNLYEPLSALRAFLLDTLADLEAGLDFADESIEFIEADTLRERIETARAEIDAISARMTGRYRPLSERIVALVGPPNVGKSALFNRMKERFGDQGATPDAIVSNRAGTTRDWLETRLNLDGLSVRLVDTAGQDGPDAAPGSNGSPRNRIAESARSQTDSVRAGADLLLECVEWGKENSGAAGDISAESRRMAHKTGETIRIITKSDLGETDSLGDEESGAENTIRTSAKESVGLDELAAAILRFFGRRSSGDAVPSTAQRCRSSLDAASRSLERGARLVGKDEILVAAELRLALDAVGRVTGAVYTDDLLDRVFSRFCIGK